MWQFQIAAHRPDSAPVLRRNRRSWVVVSVVACTMCAIGASPPVPAASPASPGSQASRTKRVRDLPVTLELRADLARAVRRSDPPPRTAVGPLRGRRCKARSDDRRCTKWKRYRIVASRLRQLDYASAAFVIDRREVAVDFARRPGQAWAARLGFNSLPPIPCEVLEHWGREC
jgi:hypothetical protein